MPGTTGRLSFHARVAANMLAIVERELAQDTPEHTAATTGRHSRGGARQARRREPATPRDLATSATANPW